jgi:hypothetical protein
MVNSGVNSSSATTVKLLMSFYPFSKYNETNVKLLITISTSVKYNE